MSYTDNKDDTDEVSADICANCGKGEENTDSLKACTACKMVKYCNRECQIAHRPQHKKECKKRAAELHDELLFKQPTPSKEDCPICFLRLPYLASGQRYQSCCGKVICGGCSYAPVYDDQGNKVDIDKQNECAFCRVVAPKSVEGMVERLNKRVEASDAIATFNLGCCYRDGKYGYTQDYEKALELWHRSGELGYSSAYHNIGNAYHYGRGVEVDKQKAKRYHKQAAMGGDETARHTLGLVEEETGNMERAVTHHMIAVRGGYSDSLNRIKKLYSNGQASKDDYKKALQSYQAYLGEIKSKQRDEAATAREDYRYY